ncbi:MAG: hypothetical protein HLUCCA11_20355 [Phormidesmis priestleyi Ana]|uniref:Uncharacterized protein n=1 Tax=Phormidesmis priestleyi Ana TaxID=1666911 RepID=A0A0P8BGL0_9CYAN|nr:MAG: hypothetical protein HLUCCA11_20355 [Phormidesmis priestleyi Ana]
MKTKQLFYTRTYTRIYTLISAAIVSCGLALIATPVWAQQVQGGKILQESIDATKVSTAAMDEMWIEIFATDGELYNQVVRLATVILIVGFFFFMLSFARAMKANDLDKIMDILIWGVIISIFLQGQGAVLKKATVTARDFINDRTKSVLLVQIGTLTIQDALQDVILTDQARERVKQAFSDCEAKEGDAQLACLETGAEEAAAIVKEYEDNGFWPAGLRRFAGNVNTISRDVKAARASGELNSSAEAFGQWDSDVSSLIWQSATNSSSREFLKSFQNWFTFGFEFAMLLTGLLGPLAVAASLIPKQPRALVSWAIAFFSIGILKLSYNLLIGFAAVYASKSQMQDLGSSGFLLMMSMGAPLISIAVAGGGGAAIFFALGRTTAMVATIIPMAGSAAAGAMPTRR